MELLILIGGLVLAVGLDPRPVKKRVVLQNERLCESFKAVQLSDFHCGSPQKIQAWTKEEQPDFIFITGDLFDERRPIERALTLVEQLTAIAPVYFVSGNHEYKNRRRSYAELRQSLVDRGVVVLDNRTISLRPDLQLTGIEDCVHFKTGSELDQEKAVVERLMSEWDPVALQIVLLHRPDHEKQFARKPVGLLLSGHAHGGQIRIPGLLNGLFAPQQGLFPKRAGGVYPIYGGVQIVSRGLSFFPWLPRFFNRPELIVIEMKKG